MSHSLSILHYNLHLYIGVHEVVSESAMRTELQVVGAGKVKEKLSTTIYNKIL